ncbi:hypothetical protein J6590_020943 [Homalodisca vitripennis]|nr:hypothetical protein J6590_020943 [Homalodisca vitripennis]
MNTTDRQKEGVDASGAACHLSCLRPLLTSHCSCLVATPRSGHDHDQACPPPRSARTHSRLITYCDLVQSAGNRLSVVGLHPRGSPSSTRSDLLKPINFRRVKIDSLNPLRQCYVFPKCQTGLASFQRFTHWKCFVISAASLIPI